MGSTNRCVRAHRGLRLAALLTVAVGAAAVPAAADGSDRGGRQSSFQHVGSFFLTDNLRPGEPVLTPTSAEITDISDDGRTLVYTDGYTGRLGIVDVRRPDRPRPVAALDLPGAPTSVAIHRRWALVAVVTSTDPDGDGPLNEFDTPRGELVVIDLGSRQIVHTIDLFGQPDSIAIAPSGRYAAIVIENERDEDDNDGLLPQPPPGRLMVLTLDGDPDQWGLRTVRLTGLADVAPDDPEPEFVDINRRDQAVVSLQENNHLVVVDLKRARVLSDFSAGTVDLTAVDTIEEAVGPQGAGLISLDGALTARRREPDAVGWIDDNTVATANEGDYVDAAGVEGGSRSFTLFNVSGPSSSRPATRSSTSSCGRATTPESRSENKGSEPEGLEVGTSNGRTYLFVAAERANAVGVYDVSGPSPRFVQVLPTGIGPEGLHFEDGLLAVTAETDGADEGFPARPLITLFEIGSGDPAYPYVVSADDAAGLPIPWVALSGLAGDPDGEDDMWAVSDSALGQSYVYRVDVSDHPAVITERLAIGGTDVSDQETGDFDLEGIAARPEGGFWLASEGRTDLDSSRPNLLVRAASDGTVVDAVRLPEAVVAGANSSGFEGVAVTGREAAGDETVWVAVQREWGGDPARRCRSWSRRCWPTCSTSSMPPASRCRTSSKVSA